VSVVFTIYEKKEVSVSHTKLPPREALKIEEYKVWLRRDGTEEDEGPPGRRNKSKI